MMMKSRNKIVKQKNVAFDLKKEADAIFEKTGERPTGDQLLKMFRKSGIPFGKLVKEVKRIEREMAKDKAEMEAKGKYFDEREYLKGAMDSTVEEREKVIGTDEREQEEPKEKNASGNAQ